MTAKLVYGRTTAAERGVLTTHEATWPEIIELFREPVRRKVTTAQYQAMAPKDRAWSKNTGLFFGGRCKDGRRTDSSLLSRSIVNLDLDDHCEAIWDDFVITGRVSALDGLSYLIHTTRSHSDDAPKLRILIPLSREVTPAEYEPVARALAERIDESMDAVARESYVPAQGMYFPSVSSDQAYHFAAFEGEFYNPADALVRYPADNASLWPKRKRESVSVYVPGRRMTHPEDKKSQAPIITAVHRAFDPWTFIEEFLSHVYVPAGDRYYPVGATGAPSVRVYDGAFVHSDHGSDPAVGQHNTFDLGRIHLFGHLDAEYDTSSLPPPEWPSYRAMVDFMLERPEVREKLAEVEAELAEERAKVMSDLLDSLDPDDIEDEDELDDLIGEPSAKKALTIEDVLAKVRRSLENAKSLDDLERRLEIIRSFPVSDFRDLHRDLISTDVQRKFAELAGEKISKASARKMLAPTIENLREQMRDKPLPDWLKDWVYITGENKFMNLETKEVLSKEGFNGRFNKATGDQFGSTDMGLAKLTAFDAATQIFCVPMPYCTKYHPDMPPLFSDDGLLCANTYRRPIIESGGYKGNEGVKLLKRLLSDLFPEKLHQDYVLDFIAHCVKYPGRKLKYALLIKGSEDEGKSLFAKLMRKLIGNSNSAFINSELLKEKFNGWAHEKVLAVVEEVKLPGKDGYFVLNQVKPVITNDEISIRKMQKDATTERNFCNMYLTTNFEDCLPMEEDNTRFLVLFTRFRNNQEVKDWRAERIKDEGRDYVRDLWDHIEERPQQFVEFFSKYEFSSSYDPVGRAPFTEFKVRMAEDAKSEERQLLDEYLENQVDPTITPDVLLWSSFKTVLDRHGLGSSLKGRGVSAFLKQAGFVRVSTTRLSVKGEFRKVCVWTRNLTLLDSGCALTGEGIELVRKAIIEADELDDADSILDNVVPFRR